MKKLEDLKIWKKSIELTKQVYQIITELPSNEKYGLSLQIKRSAISIASNIADGAGRNSNKEFVHFLSVANGSCYELQTQLILVKELDILKNNKINDLIKQCIEIQKMNYVFQKKLTHS